MNDELFYAILAMDAYYRDSDGELSPSDIDAPSGTGTSLGLATKLRVDDLTSGFFGISWNYSGKTVLSYRGTNEGTDIWAWQQFLDLPFSTQGQEALQFYRDHNGGSLSNNQDIVLTGHSLGGGLAGWVSGFTGGLR